METQQKTTTKGGFVFIRENPFVSYSIPLPFGFTLRVQPTANAWWGDPHKVYALISAFEIGAKIEEACVHAGITLRQYKYFVKKHPIFKEARPGYEAAITLRARKVIVDAIQKGDIKIAWKYLLRKNYQEFRKLSINSGYISPQEHRKNIKKLAESTEKIAKRAEMEEKKREEIED